jgi:hypothetical protein
MLHQVDYNHTPLGTHGGSIKQFFDKETLGYFAEIFNSFAPSKTEHQTISAVLCEKFGTSGETKREVQDINLPPHVRKLVTDRLQMYFGKDAYVVACECWQDYSFYENNLHIDDADSVNNVLIVSITADPFTGTQFWSEDARQFIYSIPEYNKAFYLLNSTEVMHGMKFWVPLRFLRKSVYINFNK